jgi:hypothetical protein
MSVSAWTAIAHIEISSPQSSIVFSNIPQLYDDLVIKASLKDSGSNPYADIDITLNGESSRSWRSLYYVPSSVASNQSGSFNIVGNSSGVMAFSNMEIYIPNYKSTQQKSISSENVVPNNSASQYLMSISSNLITNSMAINSITLFHTFATFNFVQYSSATLYGITKGSSGGVTVS